MNATAQSRSVSSILVVLFLGLSAIYFIPYLVPEHDGLSFSYLVGFSNRTAIVLLLIFILGFALWTRGLGLHLPDSSCADAGSFRRTGYIAVTCSIAGALFIWFCAGPIAPFGEAQYFLDRYAMFSMGGRLYRDFTFYYGPLMFYPSVWIARLCHISLGNSYYITWILQWALGSWVLYRVVEVAARGSNHGRAIFLLLWIFFFTGIPNSGSNYTPLRFCASLAFALAIHSLIERGVSIVAIFGLASIGATVLLLYSPEQGIAFTVGTILFIVICVRPVRIDMLAGLASFALIMSLVFWLALKIGVLDTVADDSGGYLNFPLLLSFQTLVLLLLLLVAGCYFIAGVRAHTSMGPLFYLICLSLVSAPAAFSRADIGHIIFNTLGALIAALVVLSQYRAIWRWTWPAFTILLLLTTYGNFSYFVDTTHIQVQDSAFVAQNYSPRVNKAYTTVFKLIHRNAQVRLDRIRASVNQDADRNALPLPSHTVLLAPFGVQRRLTLPPDGIQVVTGRYPWLYPITSIAAIQTKISEMEAHPDWPLLLLSRGPLVCEYDHSQERLGLQKFLVALYMPPLRQTIHAVHPLCDYINASYVVSSYASPVPHLFVWVRKGNATVSIAGQ